MWLFQICVGMDMESEVEVRLQLFLIIHICTSMIHRHYSTLERKRQFFYVLPSTKVSGGKVLDIRPPFAVLLFAAEMSGISEANSEPRRIRARSSEWTFSL